MSTRENIHLIPRTPLILLPITTKAVCFCRMLNVCEASEANNVDPEQTVAVCFCANIIVNYLNKYMQQHTSMLFSVNSKNYTQYFKSS